jgi:hypothetical protein
MTSRLGFAGLRLGAKMAKKPSLRETWYVVDAYSNASYQYGRYRETGETGNLLEAALELCRAFARLIVDGEFWGAVHDLQADAERDGEAIRRRIGDVQSLTESHLQTLLALGVAADTAQQLVSSLNFSVRALDAHLGGEAIENLRSRVDDLRREICEGYEENLPRPGPARPPETRQRFRRIVRRTIKCLGGVVIIVIDGVAEVHGIDASASMVVGVNTMVTAFDDQV